MGRKSLLLLSEALPLVDVPPGFGDIQTFFSADALQQRQLGNVSPESFQVPSARSVVEQPLNLVFPLP